MDTGYNLVVGRTHLGLNPLCLKMTVHFYIIIYICCVVLFPYVSLSTYFTATVQFPVKLRFISKFFVTSFAVPGRKYMPCHKSENNFKDILFLYFYLSFWDTWSSYNGFGLDNSLVKL